MIELMGWLAFLTGWITLIWIGGAIGEWLIPMLQRSRAAQEGKRKDQHPISK